MFFHLAVIDAQELVGPSSHVNEVRLALSPFLVHEREHRVIRRRFLNERAHHQKKCFSRFRGAVFRHKRVYRLYCEEGLNLRQK